MGESLIQPTLVGPPIDPMECATFRLRPCPPPHRGGDREGVLVPPPVGGGCWRERSSPRTDGADTRSIRPLESRLTSCQQSR